MRVGERSVGRDLRRWVTALGVVVVVALMIATAQGLWNTLRQSQWTLHSVAMRTAYTLDSFLGAVMEDLRVTRDMLVVAKGATMERLLIQQFMERQPWVHELVWLTEAGDVRVAEIRSGEMPMTIVEQPWSSVVRGGETYARISFRAGEEMPDLIVGLAVWRSGQFDGTLLARLDLTPVWSALLKQQIGRRGSVFLMDDTGAVLLHPALGRRQLRGGYVRGEQQWWLQALDESRLMFYQRYDGTLMLASGILLRTFPWMLVAELPVVEIAPALLELVALPFSLLLLTLVLVVGFRRFTREQVSAPLQLLLKGAKVMRGGQLRYRVDFSLLGHRVGREFAALAEALNAMAGRLQETIAGLEQRVADRTRILRATNEVSRASTSILDPEVLMRQVVELIREHFDLYYVGLFLLDEVEEFAVLRAGTGEAGEQMLAARHRLRVGGDSMIGQCVATGEARIALYAGEETVRYVNPLLPDTQSELALPMRSRGRVIGAITVQSTDPAAFSEADIEVMQTMADQVAVAIDNARLFARTQEALAELEALQQRYQAEAWERFLRYRGLFGFERTGAGFVPLDGEWAPEAAEVVNRESLVVKEGEAESSVMVPIVLRGQTIGVMGVRKSVEKWNQNSLAFLEAVAQQFAQAADNLRLLDETSRRAARERLIAHISSRIRATLDVDTVLKTALREMQGVFDLDEAEVRIALETGVNEGEESP